MNQEDLKRARAERFDERTFAQTVEDGLKPVLAKEQPVITDGDTRYRVTSLQAGHFNAKKLDGGTPTGGEAVRLPCNAHYVGLVMTEIIPGWAVPIAQAAGAGTGAGDRQ